jgi:hypothetical protein
MDSKRIRLMSVAAGLVVFMASGAAFAQAKDAAGGGAAAGGGDKGDGYGYEFDDDPLSAGGFGPNDATIRVRPRAARTTLIRPRIQFVDEMLKSVENL